MKFAVVSVGNPLRGDDNIGNVMLSKLRDLKKRGFLLVKGETNPENYVEKIKKFNPRVLYFIDAIYFGGEVGDVKIFDVRRVQQNFPLTHSVPIHFFKLVLPQTRIKVIGIQPARIRFGRTLSRELEEKIPKIKNKIIKLLVQRRALPCSSRRVRERS